jgi:hypothetical protein
MGIEGGVAIVAAFLAGSGRLAGAGGRLVPARNPYWDRWDVTIADPDGYRLVLSHRTWR